MNKLLLHVEGFFVLLFSIYWYATMGLSWILFAVLLFAPDLAMLGYLTGHKTGAVIYNMFHTYSLPILIVLIASVFSQSLWLAVGLIWLAHIGMDRMIGYGLKYPTAFKDTHLNRV